MVSECSKTDPFATVFHKQAVLLFLIRVFRRAVMNTRDTRETTFIDGSNQSISSPNFWTALSATGSLFKFLGRPSSMALRCCARRSSFTKALNPGAGSVLTPAKGSSRGWTSASSWMMTSRSFWCRYVFNNLVKVYEVTLSRKTNIIWDWCSRLSMSAEKKEPTVVGGSEELCFKQNFGNLCKEAHW